VDGLCEGKGSHFWAVDSKKDLEIKGGDMYQGEFHANKIHGAGNRYTKEGRSFAEEWDANVKVKSVETTKPGDEPPESYRRALAVVAASRADDSGLTSTERSRLQALLGGAKQQATKLFAGQSNVTQEVGKENMKATATLVFKDCVGCSYTITSLCTKVMVQGCKDCRFVFQARVVTSVVELYQCQNISCDLHTQVKTMQVDMCDDVDLVFHSHDNFQSIVWAGAERIKATLHSEEHGLLSHSSGFQQIMQLYPTITEEQKTIEQLIVRCVSGKLLEERLIRLANGFPTTEREAKEFNRKQEMNMQKLAQEAGITIGRKQKAATVGRNDPCVCGSGKKYKKCCGAGGGD